MIPNNPNYPYLSRSVIDLFNTGALSAVKAIYVDPDYGYFVQLSYFDGSYRITFGNDLGLNTGSSGELAKDKGHTKKILRSHGISCPKGQEFLLPWWDHAMSRGRVSGSPNADSSDLPHLAADVVRYIVDEVSFPVYIKPITGSKGTSIYRISAEDQVEEVLREYDENRVRLAVVEETIDLPDYRIVILDGELVSAYRRIPLSVVGDGRSSIFGLLEAKQRQWASRGRDTKLEKIVPRAGRELAKAELTLDTLLEAGSMLTLLPVSNLSLGGDSLDVSAQIHRRWVELACRIATVMGLRLAGVDLACQDITTGTAAYSVLEVNASPGLDHYALSGREQEAIVQALYARVLNASGYQEAGRDV